VEDFRLTYGFRRSRINQITFLENDLIQALPESVSFLGSRLFDDAQDRFRGNDKVVR
jgi:hypothetical protein